MCMNRPTTIVCRGSIYDGSTDTIVVVPRNFMANLVVPGSKKVENPWPIQMNIWFHLYIQSELREDREISPGLRFVQALVCDGHDLL